MNVGTIVFLITVVVLIGAAAVLVARRPRRGVELEPPKAPPTTKPTAPERVAEAPTVEAPTVEAPPEVVAPVKPSFRDRLAKARGAFAGAIGSVLSRSKIDD